ncbi:MAG: class I SAM-dependent methyltransferase [Planctomycetota bacterium]
MKTAVIEPTLLLTTDSKELHCFLGDSPVELMATEPDIKLTVQCANSEIIIQPQKPLPRRCTIRPMALYENARGYFDVTTAMGRMGFSRGSESPQSYHPFSHDRNRKLRKLYLCVESMPEDDHPASRSRWRNTLPIAAELWKACELAWNPPTQREIDWLLTFAEWPVPIEACVLYGLTRRYQNVGKCFVEIGSYRGSSLMVLAMALNAGGTDLPIFSVDPHVEHPFNRDHALLALRQIGEASRLIQMPLPSDKAASLIAAESAGLVFIDGDHSYEQAKSDILHYDRLLSPGGCLVLHDYGFGAHNNQPDPHPGVRRAVDEILFDSSAYKPILSAHTMIAFAKK